MRNKFISIPFATAGDVLAVPNATQPDGSVSWNQGFGPDYERDQATDPLAKPIPRNSDNYLKQVFSALLREWQTEAFPEWISPADNTGAAFPYDKQTVVRYRPGSSGAFVDWVSLVDVNTAVPGDASNQWQLFITNEATALETATGTAANLIITPRRLAGALSGLTLSKYNVGDVFMCAANTPPANALKMNGAAISRTTYATLFARIGTTFGVGDGSTTFNLPDGRGVFIRGWDDGKGTDVGRAFGSNQLDAFQSHLHRNGTDSARPYSSGSVVNDYLSATISTITSTGSGVGVPTVDGANGTPRTAAETRPTNIALLACIQYQ